MIKFTGKLDLDASMKALRKAQITFSPPKAIPIPNPREAPQVGRIAYLPIEVSAREFPSKVWLAGELAKLGFEVILGATWSMGMNGYGDLPPGVILFKTMNYFDANNMAIAARNGHAIAVLNEELFSLKPDEYLYDLECHPAARSQVDLLCAQGPKQAEIYTRLLPASASVVTTGNPRAVRGNPEEHKGTEILVCLMTGNTNGIIPLDEYMATTFRALGRADKPIFDLMAEQIEHEIKHHSLILERANELALENPDITIRVRPHPVERADLYETTENVTLDDRTPISERLEHAARVVFVSGCGTGIEASLAGIPAERVGSGGHGASSGPLTDIDFLDGPSRLPLAISEFQRRNSRPSRTPASRAWLLRRSDVEPGPFHLAKFPTANKAHLAQYLGTDLNVRALGWNVWSITK